MRYTPRGRGQNRRRSRAPGDPNSSPPGSRAARAGGETPVGVLVGRRIGRRLREIGGRLGADVWAGRHQVPQARRRPTRHLRVLMVLVLPVADLDPVRRLAPALRAELDHSLPGDDAGQPPGGSSLGHHVLIARSPGRARCFPDLRDIGDRNDAHSMDHEPLADATAVDSNVLGKIRTILSLDSPRAARSCFPLSPSARNDDSRERVFLSERTGANTTMRRPMNPALAPLAPRSPPSFLSLSGPGGRVGRDGWPDSPRCAETMSRRSRHGYATAIAIKDARVVAAPGKVYDPGTVVVRGGVIEAVGPARRRRSPSTPR